MALDLATLQRGIDRMVPSSASCREAEKVNAFIKAYYYDTAGDFCGWLRVPENLSLFSLRHCLALILCEKSPLAKLKRKQRAALRENVEAIWKDHVGRQKSGRKGAM